MYLKIIVVLLFVKFSSSSRILCVAPMPSYSHQIVFQQVWKELSLRGHELVVLTTNPMKDTKLVNFKEIDLSASYDFIEKQNITEILNGEYGILSSINRGLQIKNELADFQLQHPEVQALINNKSEHFDLVIVENIILHMYALSHRFKCPTIGILSLGLNYNSHASIGNPFNPGTNPSHFLPFYSNLSFLERVASTLFNIIYIPLLHYSHNSGDASIKKHFGNDYPTISEMSDRVDMIFANVNPVFKVPNPTVPALIEFGGGIHIKQPKPLPSDLQLYLDGSKEGVIYFSLGSNVKSKNIPEETKNVLLKTFSELPYDVLWKFEDKNLTYQPKNVKIYSWLPQMDVLSHPNIKVFISQCGLQSLEEALYSHVPVIAMPFFADQWYNGKMVQDKGMGILVNHKNMEKDELKNAIYKVIKDPSFKQRLLELAKLSKDVPMSGLEKIIFWTEYVIRHKGAKHLRSATVDIPFYKYYLLDVLVFLTSIIFSLIFIACISIRFVYRKFTNKIKTD